MILPIHNANRALEMLLLFGLQKWPMGNITAAVQILEQILSLPEVYGVGRIRHFEPVLIPTKQLCTDCECAIEHCTVCLDMVWQYLLGLVLVLFFSVLVVALLSLQFFLVAEECLHLSMDVTGQVSISWTHFHHVSGETVTRIPFLPHLLNTGY